MMRCLFALPLLLLVLLQGCASYYNAPGGAADMSVFGVSGSRQAAMTDSSVAAQLDKRPAASIPAVIALAHVQAPGYSSYCERGYGTGKYSVVTNLDAEKPEDLERLRKLPMVRDVALMSRLVLPSELRSDIDLRAAAGALHADMLLVYTFDTTFRTDDFASPLTLVTLGLFPSKTAQVSTTASAALIDTRTGYIYGTTTGRSRQSQLANSWTSEKAADDARLRAEREALDEVLTGVEQLWGRVILDSPSWAGRAAAAPVAQQAPSGWSWERVAPGNTYRTEPKR